MYLIAGLGNYGEKYTTTRHNAAWLVLDEMLSHDVAWGYSKYANADYLHDVVGDTPVQYIKPHTMMNLSGRAVQYAAEKHEISPDNIIIIHDDIDIPVGELKISFNRGSGNHNGIESINAALGTREYIRIRVGIGSRGPVPLRSYVLMNLPDEDLNKIKKLAPKLNEAIRLIIEEGLEKAMNEMN